MNQTIQTTGWNFLKTANALTSVTLETLLDWQRRFGELYTINMGPLPGFQAVADLEMVDTILVKERARFKKAAMYDGLALMTGRGLVTNEGAHWKKQRRLANPAFRREYLDDVFALMMEEVDASMDAIAAREGEVVHWEAEATALAMNVVVKVLIGSTLEGDTERFSAAAQLGLAHAMRLWKDPFFKYTQHLSGAKRRFDAENAFLGELIDRFIRERKATGNAGKRDILSMFMTAVDEDTGEPMPDQQLRDEIITMFLGGHETSAHTLAWGMLRLRDHPEVMAKVRAEVEAVTEGAPLSREHLRALNYTTMVVNEMLRIDAAVWTIARTNLEPVRFPNGLEFPANTQFMIPIYAIQRNPKYWPRPDAFEPERFADGLPKGALKHSFMPFGAGERICIGRNFAMMQLVAIVASLLRRFDVEVLSSSASYEAAITLAPTSHIDIRVRCL
ncbi:Cytochrome P450 [Plesiocystis pacifica SIR-1]|uniref:Cytochrome P450 n=1 Tax=Plesiocystis pacifica SIR-1 TaxID=391625 RepID=A6GCY6_9BACT|nr:cytochrome P450 [Plesiocystis pacifica]EDM76310.1 Cytochrome P450 [Plesiocystis pacifica SIR-1]